MKRIGAVVLAAGASTRLGEPKQLAMVGNENLLERSIRTAGEAGCSPIVVVLGASADLIQTHSNLEGAQVLVNDCWQQGMASSIRIGIAALPGVDGAIVMVCDMPAVTPAHLRALVESGEMTASAYAGRRGVPAYMPSSMFPALLQLEGDTGARDLLRAAPSKELAGGELDIDTENDLVLARHRFRS